jgi:hypothetical protein
MLKARDLINMTIDEVWELPDGPMRLQFDDGVVETTTKETIFSRYIWEIHRAYPQTPILTRHHIKGRLGSDTHLKLLGNAVWDCRDAYLDKGGADMELLSELSYQIINGMYNDISLKLEEHVGSISILDFVEVMNHPKIAQAMKDLGDDPTRVNGGQIETTYARIKSVLLDPTELIGNGIAKAGKSGLVSMGQILQCVGPRGLTTDIDSHIFRRPILRGFGYGMMTLEDTMKESRSAAKASFYAKDPMRQSEYFNRQQQIAAGILFNLHHTDCGSQEYIPFMVKPGDIPVKPGDDCCLEGIHFFDPAINRTRPVVKTDRHLIGKTIMLRTVFTCKHPDPYGVCVTCYGELGLSFPAGTNVGHFSTSELLGQIAQRILSTKHEDSSANVETVVLDEFEEQFLRVGPSGNDIVFTDFLVGKKFKLYFPVEEAPYLPDLTLVANIRSLTPNRISELSSSVDLEYQQGKDTVRVTLTVSTEQRKSFLSLELLKYIKDHGWTITPDECYCIDMTEWKKGATVLELPLKHFSTVDYMHAVGGLIKGTGGKRGAKSLKSYETVSGSLMAVNELVNSKLKVNLSHIQTTIFTMMVNSEEDRDYRLPMPRSNGTFAPYKQIMSRRSLAPAMAYQSQTEIMYSFETFNLKVRPDHPLDDMLCPFPTS